MNNQSFSEWLRMELERRHWSQADFSRAINSTPATVSRLMGGSRMPGNDLCLSIAQAFQVPPEIVLAAAGVLPGKSNVAMDSESINHKLSLLSPNSRLLVIDFIQLLLEREKKAIE